MRAQMQSHQKLDFSDSVVVLMARLRLLAPMVKDATKISPAKMGLSVVVQIKGLLHKDLTSRAVLSVLRRYVRHQHLRNKLYVLLQRKRI